MRTSPSHFGRRGGTLTELMVSVAILSIGVLGLFSAFQYIGRSIFVSRAQSLATNLAQERIEALKNVNYYGLMLSTATATDATVTPNIVYDTANYPPETIAIGGIRFTRYTYVNMAELSGSDIVEVSANYPDTGLKQITVDVVWTDNGRKKRWQLKNLLENPNVNPLDASISGTVSNAAGGVVAGAIVSVEQNEDWQGTTNAAGYYTFRVYHGTYTVRASSSGFYDAVSSPQVVNRGQDKSVPLTLTSFATGSVSGIAWFNSDLVISQVVAATMTVADGATRSIEYIELFNPTTGNINIGVTANPWPKPLSVLYTDYTGSGYYYDQVGYGAHEFDMVNVTTFVPARKYYLIANASFFYINGGWIAADAYYPAALSYPNYIDDDKGGSIGLYRFGPGRFADSVGWHDSSATAPWWYENAPLPNTAGSDGLGSPPGRQLVRVSSPAASAATHAVYGRAYDGDYNTRDFLSEGGYFMPLTISPRNTTMSTVTVISGKPAYGSYISANDPNSGSTQTFTTNVTSGALSLPIARYQLGGVSTGTWTVIASFPGNVWSPHGYYYPGGYWASFDNVVVAQGAYAALPGAATAPTWDGAGLAIAVLQGQYGSTGTVTTGGGFVKGVITNTSGTPLNGITVAGGGGSKTTGTNGQYFMPVSSGTISLVVNANNASNGAYVQEIAVVTITEGMVTTQDFSLSMGGRLTGYLTTGSTPLSGQPVTATNGSGSQIGSGTTDGTGYFTMRNISTGTNITVAPVLESGQDASPNSATVNLTSTGTLFVATFTVSGAFGSIAGTVSDAGGLITSGSLILASTNSISATPPQVVGSSAPALTPTYMVSSKADGTYTLPVRGGATYYVSVYVPVISPAGTVSITTKTYSGIVVAPSAATTRNVTLP